MTLLTGVSKSASALVSPASLAQRTSRSEGSICLSQQRQVPSAKHGILKETLSASEVAMRFLHGA